VADFRSRCRSAATRSRGEGWVLFLLLRVLLSSLGAVQIAPAAEQQIGQPVQGPVGREAGTAAHLSDVERGVEDQLQRDEQRRDPGVAPRSSS